MSREQADWLGKSGTSYSHWIYPIEIGDSLKDFPGNYIYAKKNSSSNQWQAVYIGQASNLGDRLASHEQETCALRNGATCIHAHNGSIYEKTRKAEEKDLIANCKPVCNDQHK